MAPEKLLRGEQNRHPELTGTPARVLQESAGNLLGGSGGWRAAGLADLEADKTPHRDVFAEIDRKSTRLNSSHGSISYAVFCLKKKKNNTKKTINYTYIDNNRQKE